MRRLTRSWSIFRKSLAVINQERKLLIFPLISAFAMFALILLIIAGIGTVAYLVIGSNPEMMQSMAAAAESAESAEEEPGMLVQIVSVAIFAVFYLVTMVLTNFCNVAFYSEIIRGIYGEPVRIGRGFGYALSRFKAIFLWSLLASTVGVILSMLSERAGLLGKLIIRLIGVVWAVASAFAIPALVCDPALDQSVSGIEAVRRCNQKDLGGIPRRIRWFADHHRHGNNTAGVADRAVDRCERDDRRRAGSDDRQCGRLVHRTGRALRPRLSGDGGGAGLPGITLFVCAI